MLAVTVFNGGEGIISIKLTVDFVEIWFTPESIDKLKRTVINGNPNIIETESCDGYVTVEDGSITINSITNDISIKLGTVLADNVIIFDIVDELVSTVDVGETVTKMVPK